MTYDWMATIGLVATLMVVTSVGRYLVFQIPAFAKMREMNREADRVKLKRDGFKDAVKVNNKWATVVNAIFFVAVMPFLVTLEARPVWRAVVDVFAILFVYDLFYYFTHRFVFHGKMLRKVHSLHHQAHTPTYIDALYVHPIETTIGLLLFLGTIPLIALATGGPLNMFSVAAATVIFTQLNTINHTFVDLPFGPYKVVDKITSLHAAHHVDMNQGNYATLTMLFDWLFGTLEAPVSRSTP